MFTPAINSKTVTTATTATAAPEVGESSPTRAGFASTTSPETVDPAAAAAAAATAVEGSSPEAAALHFYPLSLTEPRFSLQDLQDETAALSEQERQEAVYDMQGWRAIPVEPDLEQLTRRMEVILETDATLDTKAYRQALECCPDVVQTESSCIAMLRAADYCPAAAAVRVGTYWKMRLDIFQDRAFLPRSLLLTAHEREVLALGAVQVLPQRDAGGRTLLYVHKAALDHLPHPCSYAVRMAFYLLTLMVTTGDCEHVQRHGVVILFDNRNKTIATFDRKAARKFMDLLRFAFPVSVRAWHFCFPARKTVGMILLPTMLFLLGPTFRQRSNLHAGGPDELRFDLAKFGIGCNNDDDGGAGRCVLPPTLGGTFMLTDFVAWLAMADDQQP